MLSGPGVSCLPVPSPGLGTMGLAGVTHPCFLATSLRVHACSLALEGWLDPKPRLQKQGLSTRGHRGDDLSQGMFQGSLSPCPSVPL